MLSSDTSCRHPSRVQERSVEALRIGKTYQAAQWLLCGRVCPADGRGNRFPYQHTSPTVGESQQLDGRGNRFPYQHTQCRKGAQCPVGKAVLAKRKAGAVDCIG